MDNLQLRYFGILEKALKQFFEKQNNKILASYNNNFDLFKKEVIKIIETDKPRAEKILKDIYTQIILDYGAWQFAEIAGNLDGFNPQSSIIISEIAKMAKDQAQIISNTSKSKIIRIGEKAVKKGWTIQKTTKLLQKEFKHMEKWRARRIARFETLSGTNFASLQTAKQVSGKVKKYWIYTHDKRTRKTHRQAGIKYNKNNAIDLDQKFKVGKAELKHPCDRNGSADEIYNCRCTIGYVRKE